MGHKLARLYVQKRGSRMEVFIQGRSPRGQYYMWDVVRLDTAILDKVARREKILTKLGSLLVTPGNEN